MRFDLVQLGHSPNWYVQWREKGAKRRVSARTTDRAKAEAFLAAFRLSYVEEEPEDWPALWTVLDWYYDGHASKKASAQQAKIAITHLKSFFGATAIPDLKHSKQERYIEARRETGMSDATIGRELSVLNAALRKAYKDNKLPATPPPVATVPAAPPRERYLERDEVARFFWHLHGTKRHRHLLLFARLALYTGARSGAILELTWDRVNLHRGWIDYTLPGEQQTNKRKAKVPIDTHLVRMLAHAKRRSNHTHVITYNGESVDRIVRAFRRQAKLVGLNDVTPHTLRHTFGTWAAEAGESLFLVGRALGHTKTSTTERYAKHQTDALRGVMKAVRRKKPGQPGGKRGK
jgi:integrase